jgi:hypothetical protein
MAADAVETYGLPRNVDPHTALLEEVWRTAGHVAWLEARVRELEEEALVCGTAEELSETGASTIVAPPGTESAAPELRVVKVKRAAAPSAWLELYQKERRHLVEVCRVAIACGIVDRQVKLAEEHGRNIAAVIAGALEDLGIDISEARVHSVVRQRLLLAEGVAV